METSEQIDWIAKAVGLVPWQKVLLGAVLRQDPDSPSQIDRRVTRRGGVYFIGLR